MKNKIIEAHEQVHNMTEIINYPTHPPRKESYLFEKNSKILVKNEKHNCFVCDWIGLTKDEEDKLEVHHFVVQWALWESCDPKEIQRLFDSGFIDIYGYSAKLKGQPVESPDDIRNLMVLCSNHHRKKGISIHETSVPSWFSNLVCKDNTEIIKGALD